MLRSLPRLVCALFPLALLACSGDDGAGGPEASGGSGGSGGAGTTQQAVTFHEDVEPLLQKHCQSCHRDGGQAPFSLMDFASTRDNGVLVAAKVASRQMPPWGAFETDECKPRHPFRDDLRMTDDEKEVFRSWVEGGMPEGDPQKAPAPVAFAPTELEGVTDSLTMPEAYTVKAATSDEFRCFVFDPGFDQSVWLNGLSVKPGNNKVVHHVLVFSDSERKALANAPAGGSYPCFGGPNIDGSQKLILAWAPGAQGADFAPNVAMQVPAKSLLVMQVHYHPTQTSDEPDLTSIQLRRAAAAPEWVADVRLIGNARSANGAVKLLPGDDDPTSEPVFEIPPNVSAHPERMEFTFPDKISGLPLPELHLSTVGTHMHLVGHRMRVEIERKNPTDQNPAQECLLETPQWDFNWQRGYSYDLPIEELPTINAGDKIKLTCIYDNTMSNPFVKKALGEQHLNEPQTVRLGEQTLDEMCLGSFLFFRKSIGGL